METGYNEILQTRILSEVKTAKSKPASGLTTVHYIGLKQAAGKRRTHVLTHMRFIVEPITREPVDAPVSVMKKIEI